MSKKKDKGSKMRAPVRSLKEKRREKKEKKSMLPKARKA